MGRTLKFDIAGPLAVRMGLPSEDEDQDHTNRTGLQPKRVVRLLVPDSQDTVWPKLPR